MTSVGASGPASTASASRSYPVWPVFATLLACIGAMTTNCADPDLWGHYQYGKEVLRDGVMPTETTWSYAVQGHPWINHENIAELATAWAVDTLGIPGLTIGKLLLAITIFGCVLWSCRRAGAGWLAIGVVGVLAADNIRFHWQFRPHAWTYACFAIMLAILEDSFSGWHGEWRDWRTVLSGSPVEPDRTEFHRLRRLWLVPPLLCLWTNTHGGFAAGLAVYCAYLGLRMIQAWAWWGSAAIGLEKRLAMMIAAGVLASLVNPYGPNLHLWMVDTLGAAPPEIGDWAPLAIWTTQSLGFWALIAVVAFALVRSRLSRDVVHLALLGLILWQGLLHCRHICFFAMMCAFWIPRHLQSAVEPIAASWRQTMAGRQPSSWIRQTATAAFVLWLGAIATQLGPKLSTIPVERKEYPVAAMQFLRDHELRGRTMVTFNWAQYAIACFAADKTDQPSLVAIDGRLNTCYPREVLDIYLDFMLGEPQPGFRLRAPTSPSYDPKAALRYENPDLFLLDRGQMPAIRTISADPNWVLLYQDSVAQIWGRKNRYDNPHSPDYFAPERRSVSEAAQVGSVQWPALPEAQEPVVVANR
jgi:hypothetical protein